ncbi:glycosyltransferase family 9 protein [Brevundimonas variabilis]|uniref:Uncharacterized protein n=1 Tax=Brevundimonas variabilis TaxID=74312 RepID=A0A7W9FF99_9CAUL|nr:hypothetical protein [Brevundimonas variabilis]MBB5747100.1 hypothetical protein [Brevundimonas variabilis]
MSNDAIFFANGFGDALMALPGMRATLRAMPEATLILPHHPAYDYIFTGFDRRIRIAPRSGLEFDWRDLDQRAGCPERLAVFTSWTSGALAEWISTVNDRGFTTGLIAEVSRSVSKTGHYTQRYFEIARNIDMELAFADHCHPLVELPRDGRLKGLGYYVLHVDTAEAKRLDDDVWTALVSALSEHRPDLHPVVVGRDPALRGPLGGAGSQIAHAPFDFGASCEIVAGATFFAGVDSSFLHLADLQQIPSVGVFRHPNHDRFGLCLTPHRVNLLVETDLTGQFTRLLSACLSVSVPPRRGAKTEPG